MTDHYTEAHRELGQVGTNIPYPQDPATAAIAIAQVHATLELANQQRIANLIALWQDEDAPRTSQEAGGALVRRESITKGSGLTLRPEITRALRIETK